MGENLSEAPKAGGRGENLIEAPLLSFKKKKKEIGKRSLSENLFEALKADGKGENLNEAPLLSLKKREKKEKKKEKKTKEKTRSTDSLCKIACRLQVFYGGEEASQLRAQDPYHAVRRPH